MNNAPIESTNSQEIPLLLSLTATKISNIEIYDDFVGKNIEKELAIITHNKEALQQLFESLFPSGIPLSIEFYIIITKLSLPDNADKDLIKKIRGKIWASANLVLSKEKFEELLNLLLTLEWSKFFIMYSSLTNLLSNTQIDPRFAAIWLSRIAQRSPADEFFNAVSASCDSFPENMVEVLNYLYEKENSYELIVASFLLGKLRTILKDMAFSQKFKKIEDRFIYSKNQKMLSIYRLSWVTSIKYAPELWTKIQTLIKNLQLNVPDEQLDAFEIICKSLQFSHSEEFLSFAQSWLKTNTSSELFSSTKEILVQFVWQQLDKNNQLIYLDLILLIQSFDPKQKNLWRFLESILVHLQNKNIEYFNSFFFKLAKKDAELLLIIMQKHQGFEWLFSELENKKLDMLIGKLVFSIDTHCRKLGFYLFEKFKIKGFLEDLFKDLEEINVQLAFYEFQRSYLDSHAVTYFLLSLLPKIKITNTDFQNDFISEFLVQAKNYGDEFIKEFRPFILEFPPLKEVIEKADHYFSQLESLKNTPICELVVFGRTQAEHLRIRNFTQQVDSFRKSYSPFESITKKISIPYGDSWRIYNEGKLGESVKFQRISSSIRIPRLGYIDPEYIAIRILNASTKITQLLFTTKIKE